ncbi:hypothetical protein ACFQ01_18565 [Williamsia serinedens]
MIVFMVLSAVLRRRRPAVPARPRGAAWRQEVSLRCGCASR